LEDNNKKSLRDLLLERRDNTSFDLLKIASKKMQKRINKVYAFKDAQKIGIYYPIGSEILTQDIIQELISKGKEVFLPKIIGENIEFRKIDDFGSLEMGKFDIMEPKEDCQVSNELDIIVVPTVGISLTGVRLGYGHGFYDKFLEGKNITTISLVLEKQIIKNIPKSDHDINMDWVITEDRMFQTQK